MAPRHRRESLHRFYIRTIRTLCIATYLRFGATHDDSKSRAKRAAAGRLTRGAGRGGAACAPATPSLPRSNCLRVTQRPEPGARLAGGYARWVAARIRGRPRIWQARGNASGKRCRRQHSASPFLKWKVNMPRGGGCLRYRSGVRRPCDVAHSSGLTYPGGAWSVRARGKDAIGAVRARSSGLRSRRRSRRIPRGDGRCARVRASRCA